MGLEGRNVTLVIRAIRLRFGGQYVGMREIDRMAGAPLVHGPAGDALESAI